MPGVIHFHGNFTGLLLHSVYLRCLRILSEFSLAFSFCFSHLFFFLIVGEVVLELPVRWNDHDLLSCLKEGRMNGLCTVLEVLK